MTGCFHTLFYTISLVKFANITSTSALSLKIITLFKNLYLAIVSLILFEVFGIMEEMVILK